MTKENEKKKPDFYIFTNDQEGNSLRVGAAFKHKKGDGFNILIDNDRFTAFPPKVKPETVKPG